MTLENLTYALYLNNLEIMKRIGNLKEELNIINTKEIDKILDDISNINEKIKKHIEDNNIHISSDIKEIVDKLSDKDGKLFYNDTEIGSGGDVKKFTTTVRGNGEKKEMLIEHNLNVTDVTVIIKDQNGETCFVDYDINDSNNITLTFTEAPAGTEVYTVTVL